MKEIKNKKSTAVFLSVCLLPIVFAFVVAAFYGNGSFLQGTEKQEQNAYQQDVQIGHSSANCPTVEDYMKNFFYATQLLENEVTLSYNASTSSTLVSWKIPFRYNEELTTIYCSLSLFQNEEGRITWCSVTAYCDKFKEMMEPNSLLSNFSRGRIFLMIYGPLYALSCWHNSENLEHFDFIDGHASNIAQDMKTKVNYHEKIGDCDCNITMGDTSITGILE